MGKSRRSSRCSFVAALALATAGCGGASFGTATELPTAPRRPDGVALEPPPALPVAAERAPAVGVVALREPFADRDVEDVVRAYLRAFEREDETALLQLTAAEAAPLGRSGASRQSLLEIWHAKIKNFEYQRIAGTEVARLSEIERHTYESLGAPGSPTRPSEMRPGDVLVRVPIATPRIGTEQLFGDTLVLLLRREDGRLKIAGQADES